MNSNINDIFEVNNNFYEKYNMQLRTIVTRILNNAGKSRDIDDCVNAVYLSLMERLQQYSETRGIMGAFVAVISRSIALNYCKDNKHVTGELIGNENIDFLSGSVRIEDDVEFRMLVENILKKLTEQESILFGMKYIYFYTHEEIAKAFNIKRNAVDGRLNRLKAKIKKFLLGYFQLKGKNQATRSSFLRIAKKSTCPKAKARITVISLAEAIRKTSERIEAQL